MHESTNELLNAASMAAPLAALLMHCSRDRRRLEPHEAAFLCNIVASMTYHLSCAGRLVVRTTIILRAAMAADLFCIHVTAVAAGDRYVSRSRRDAWRAAVVPLNVAAPTLLLACPEARAAAVAVALLPAVTSTMRGPVALWGTLAAALFVVSSRVYPPAHIAFHVALAPVVSSLIAAAAGRTPQHGPR
jgi:hypothetical protein